MQELTEYDFEVPVPLDKIRLIADAEKAFVHVMDSHYNTQKYRNYPKGTDGLAGLGLTGYGYVINEDITFETEKTSITGRYNMFLSGERTPDMIFIEGDEVRLIKP